MAKRKRKATASAPLAPTRAMWVVAQDPSVRDERGRILMAEVAVPAEALAPGPRGYRVNVIDYDPSTGEYAGEHVVPEEAPKAWREGRPEILGLPEFRAANVYALVMKTLARFEFALGRRVSWGFDSHQINVAPRGVADANAYYSRPDQGLVFGWFLGHDGKIVDTCLSHDVVVHETTHALIDGLRKRYLDPSSPDQAAFHEGYSDVIALLSVLSQKELVARLLGGMKGVRSGQIAKKAVDEDVLRESALFGLAEQVGKELDAARGGALRRSVNLSEGSAWRLDPGYEEMHNRGEILAASILKTFLGVWVERIGSLGEVVPGQVSLERVAEDGAEAADYLATMLIRALDYMPPVHVEFEDVLSAMLTADAEIRPDDSKYHYRAHLLEGFRAFDIHPSPEAAAGGAWPSAPTGTSLARVHLESLRSEEDEVFRFVWENRDALGIHEDAYTKVISVRPCLRIGPDGFSLRETVAEYYQLLRVDAEELPSFGIEAPEAMPPDTDVELYGGGTLVFDEFGRLKFHVPKAVLDLAAQEKRIGHLWRYGHYSRGSSLIGRLSTLHRMRSLGARTHVEERW
jgi:hypothetical protein